MVEQESKDISCCFTGHRPEKLNMTERYAKELLNTAINQAIKGGYTTFISGMSRGIDLWAAECVLDKRDENAEIKLICAIPYYGFEKPFSDEEKELYYSVLEKADEINYICEHYSRNCFQIRNVWMIDNSSMVIAFFNGERGGTKNTITYAKSKKLRVINMCDVYI